MGILDIDCCVFVDGVVVIGTTRIKEATSALVDAQGAVAQIEDIVGRAIFNSQGADVHASREVGTPCQVVPIVTSGYMLNAHSHSILGIKP